MNYDYLASDQPIGPELAGPGYTLYIISDYPVNNITAGDFEMIVDSVRSGAGLLMIGGWESYHGLAGEYNNSPLAEVLPVEMLDRDDRVNAPQPYVLQKVIDHPILDGLPWGRPPVIGGFNRITPKPDATEILSARQLEITAATDGEISVGVGETSPLLVTGTFGRGRTAALATDVAPHWVGTLVDWGDERLAAQGPGAEEIEVGNHYAKFFRQLVRWTMGRQD